jgi:hypothetical protein
MASIGKVESLWRYPVKSMRGEEIDAAYLGFAGVYGDRLYALSSDAAVPGFPYLTGREQRRMVLYRPRFRHPDLAAMPPNLAEAEALAPGISPVYADADGLAVDIETPEGETLAIDDPKLADRLNEHLSRRHQVKVLRSDRALTDCRPVSLCSLATVGQLGEELGKAVDKRRFRANVYLDLKDAAGYAENGFVGKTLRIGDKVRLQVLERDPRCAMITLDPDTAERDPSVLKKVTDDHEGYAGVYAAVLIEGVVKAGDAVRLAG